MSEQMERLRKPPAGSRTQRRSGGSGAWLHFTMAALLPAVILIVWQWSGAAGKVSPHLLPGPIAIAEALVTLTISGELLKEFTVSLGRAASGVFFGVAAALLLGAAVGFSRKAERLLDPTMQLLRVMPSLATAPLIILWFGFGETSKIVIIAFGAFFPMYLSTVQSIRGVDRKLAEVTCVLNYGRRHRMTGLVLPGALPELLSGLRLAIAYGWLALVVAELLGSQSGIGFLMSHAHTNAHPEIVFVGVLVFAVMGKLIDSAVATLERRQLRWRDSFTG